VCEHEFVPGETKCIHCELSLDDLCLVESDAYYAFMAGGRFCSLPKGHEGPHVAYVNHHVTGNGRDVYWLGPWKDGREYEGPQADRLAEEWSHRYE
jgi:hypothetical protein